MMPVQNFWEWAYYSGFYTGRQQIKIRRSFQQTSLMVSLKKNVWKIEIWVDVIDFMTFFSFIQIQPTSEYVILGDNLFIAPILPCFLYINFESSGILSYNREKSLQIQIEEDYVIVQSIKMSKSKTKVSKELKNSVLGVDLGSALTKISAVDKGVVDIITNEANLRQTPTIVGYGGNERLIGEAASVRIKSNLSNSILAPQRYMAIRCQQYLQEEGKHAPCQLKEQDGELSYKVNCQGQETRVVAEQAVAAFFSKVQQIIELNNINNKYLTVAVPNFFTFQERKALMDAIEITKRSGKHQFGVQIINQSAAVGLDYGFYKKGELPGKEEEAKNILFVDFGHSKLSLYVIKFTKNYQKVLYQKHLRQVGCKNLDQRMLQFYSELFEKINPSLEIPVKESKKATIKLLESIQRQRKILSGNSEYDFNIDCLLEQCDLSYTMKREEFQKIVEPAISQIRQLFLTSLQEMKGKNIPISSIQLIGGGSRIPVFIRAVSEAFGKEPQRTLNSSQCIARGAGLYSAMNSGIFRVQNYYSIELSPQTLICSWRGEDEEIQNEKDEFCLYEENQTLFSRKTLDLQLNDCKQSLIFNISTRNELLDNQNPVCSFKLSFSSAGPQRKVKLTFEIDERNMISNVSAVQMTQQAEIPLTVSDLKLYQHLSEAKIEEYARIERQQMLKDISIMHYYEKKNTFESNIYEIKEKLANFTRISEFKDFVNPISYNELIEYFNNLENQFESINDFEAALKDANAKIASFNQKTQQAKRKYTQVDKELKKFQEFINNVINGKIKGVRFYPKGDVQAARQWIEEVHEQQNGKNKFESHMTSVQEISQKTQALKAAIQKLQEEMARQKRQTQEQQYYHQPQYKPKHHQTDSSFFNPFATSYNPHPYDNRSRAKNPSSSFNGYNPGFFSGFSGFF